MFLEVNAVSEKIYCKGITVAWQLADVSSGDSGFVTITGSRESCETTSSDVRSLEDGLGLVVQPEIEVGDLLFF